MTSGGARNRSGPAADPSSGRSEARGISLKALPAEGYKGRVPTFPLPDPSERELEVWREAWRTPQAAAWAQPSEHWRRRTVAIWVRTSVRCEAPDAAPTLLAQLHRFADQIGLTPAGLAENGWKIAANEIAEKKATAPTAGEAAPTARRLRAV